MRAKWTPRALRQFKTAQHYIAQENPAAAAGVAQRISDAIELLLSQPDMGRPGRVDGTREWVVKKTPYMLAYSVEGETLEIIGVIHGKQSWPASFTRR